VSQSRPVAPAHSTASLPLLAALLLALGCQDAGSSAGPARFEISPVQTSSGPIVVRFDSATGTLRQAPMAGSLNWTPIGSPPPAGSGATRPGRYSFEFAQAASVPLTFLRLDTATGTVWRLAFRRDRDWVAFRSPDESEPAEPVPAASREQRRKERRRPIADDPPAPSGGSYKLGEQDVAAFVEAVNSSDLPDEMRTWAVEQLGKGPSEYAVGPLIDLLDDRDPAVVRSAIRALGRHGDDPRVRPALETMSQHETPELRRVAESTLSKLD
jgi:hypothetical protein